jgi:hypothetical protein
MNRIKSHYSPGHWGPVLSVLLLVAGTAGIISDAQAQANQNEMPFTATIRPWGANSLDVTILNESREPITGVTISIGDTAYKFETIYPGSLIPGGRVLEPSYVPGGVGLVREVWNGIGGNELTWLYAATANLTTTPSSRNLITTRFEAPINVADNYGQRIHGYLLAPETGTYTFLDRQ